ncbi:MAG: DUF373 family protein [Candidatus Micrarchaeota archaeon]|nr:DUF373 family protein [Candidatus Micrarchaeota archaeon]
MQRPLLLLCIDRDNDLYEKAKVSSPVIGREKNIDAATKLALADPEDADANAIFYSVKMYDKFKKEGKNVEVVTIAGHKNLGYEADKEISKQLDKIVRETNATTAVLISDGMSDEEIIPIIKSRITIESTKIVIVKQAKELEKTYFVLIEKLRDPHYARILLGIPAILILLLSAASYFGFGWQPVGIIVGIYLILKGFGISEQIWKVMKDFRFSIEKTSWISYIGGFALLVIAVIIAYQTHNDASKLGFTGEKHIAYIIRSVVVLILVSVLLIITGKVIDALAEKQKFAITKYSLYAVAATLAVLVLKVGSDWVLNYFQPYVSFEDFLVTLVGAVVIGYISTRIIKDIRAETLSNMKLEGKEVINEYGNYVGKIVGVNGADGTLVIQTLFDKRFFLPFKSVSGVGENIIVKGNE